LVTSGVYFTLAFADNAKQLSVKAKTTDASSLMFIIQFLLVPKINCANYIKKTCISASAKVTNLIFIKCKRDIGKVTYIVRNFVVSREMVHGTSFAV
jgi:hypothetical protein